MGVFQDEQVHNTVVEGQGGGGRGQEEEEEEEDEVYDAVDQDEKEYKKRCVEIQVQDGCKDSDNTSDFPDPALMRLSPFVAIRDRHVQWALHIIYNPDERISGSDPETAHDPAAETDAFIGTFHFLLRYGVRHVGVVKQIREFLAERPSIACLLLTRAYGFCDKKPEKHLFDLEKFLLSELSCYEDEEVRKFRWYEILPKETQLRIADMRIRSLEHLFKDPGIFWKPHFRDKNEKRIMPSDPKRGDKPDTSGRYSRPSTKG